MSYPESQNPVTFVDFCIHPSCWNRPLTKLERIKRYHRLRGKEIAELFASACGLDPVQLIANICDGDSALCELNGRIVSATGVMCLDRCRLAPAVRVTTQLAVESCQAESLESILTLLPEV